MVSSADVRVVAVVVAYNRRELLAEALDGLLAQTRPADAVLVVDNASDDGSCDVARRHPVGPEVVVLPRNTGGAGGFATGLAHAVLSLSADLVWLMDDDTVPTPSALAHLLSARSSYPGEVTLLGSRAVWVDGRDHPMNVPRRRPWARAGEIAAARAAGAVPVRSSSFVSMLVDAGAVRRHGLPVAAYFLWNDDFEYSARLLRHGVGLYVPASVVEHRTRTFGSTDVDPGERFSLEVRNKVWMFTRSRALGPRDALLYGASTLRRWGRTVRRSPARAVVVRAGVRGLRQALEHGPRASQDVLAGLGSVSDEVAVLERAVDRG